MTGRLTRTDYPNLWYEFRVSVPWPSGKARVCKTLIPRFKSGRHLQDASGEVGLRPTEPIAGGRRNPLRVPVY